MDSIDTGVRPRGRVCTTLEEAEALLTRGNFHPGGNYSILRHPDWVSGTLRYLSGGARLCMPVMENGGRPVALAPLIRKPGLLSPARFAGVDEHSEPCDFLYEDRESLARLLYWLAGQNMPLFLQRLPESSPVAELIDEAYAGKALILRRPQVSCPYIETTGGEEALRARLTSSLKSDLRRAARKAAALGETSFEVHAPRAEDEFEALWQEALAVEAAGWKGRKASALANDPGLEPFYRAYADKARDRHSLRIFLMRIGARAVAMQLAIEADGRLWLLKIGYDEDYSPCSPGLLLLEEALRYAARRPLLSCEFLGDATDWTRRWTREERRNLSIRVYPFGFAGMVLLARDSSRRLARRLLKPLTARRANV